MASNFEECPTGILVDFIGNVTVAISSDEKDTVASTPSHGAKKQSFDCRTPFVKSEAINIPNNRCLGSELNRKRNEVCFSKTEWRSPSPTTMNMITFEASRIIDQLHTTLETSLWEEEFPLSSNSEDECFEDCSNEFEESQNVTVTKLCNNIGSNVEKGNVTDNPQVIDDNSATEGNSGLSKISICTDNSNVISLKENCDSIEYRKENIIEKDVETEKSFSLLKSFCVAECHTTTELPNVIFAESNLILEKGEALTVESCVVTEENSTFAAEAPTVTEEAPILTEKGMTLNEALITLADAGIALGKIWLGEGSTWTKEVSTLTEEVPTLTEEGSTLTEEGSTLTEEGSTLTEEGSTLTKVGYSPSKDFIQIEESFGVVKERCGAVTDSCFIIKDDSIITKETSKYGKIGFVAEDNVRECAEFSNSDANPMSKVLSEEVYANPDMEPNQEINKITQEAKVTPSSMKSKITKFLKTPCFKTPIKYKRLEEKENVLQECMGKNVLSERKISKIGQASSIKGILSASNSKGAMVSINKSSIKASINNISISGKTLFGRENKSTVNVPKVQAKENLETPSKKMNLLRYQPAVPKKNPVCKSYSVAETPNAATPIRRSSSFQTRQIPNTDQIRRERSFVGETRPKNWNSRMSLIQTQRIGNELPTPSKIGSYLPKSSSNVFVTPSKIKFCVKETKVAGPSFATPLRQTKSLDQDCPQVFGFKRPASTTSKTRFVSRLELPSPLLKKSNGSLSRRLSPDYNTPLKRRI